MVTLFRGGDLKEDLKELSDNQIKILAILKETPSITQRELSSQVGINEKNIRKNMSFLRDKGYITRVGGRKVGHWKVDLGNEN